MLHTFTFRGGTRVPEYKLTAGAPTIPLPPPAFVSLSMSQHIGTPAEPVVAVGDTVDKGQLVGNVEGGLGCPVHASISGNVARIEDKYNASGKKVRHIVIENDGQNRISPNIAPFSKKLADASSAEIIERIRQAGISGMGGAAFPTYAKIQSAVGKATHMIVNCAECEPYITANHRLLLERPEDVCGGALILLKALGLRHADIAVENNKKDAIRKLDELLYDNEILSVRVLKTKYPQGDERQLIYALRHIELPYGKLPADVGCVIFNAETCAAVYQAFASGMPLIERIVTCSGDCVREPKNILVPLGTPIRNLIDFCGGLIKEPQKIINGGPMMGQAQWDIDAPISKGSSSILVLSKSAKPHQNQASACIRCGRCVSACPMHLMPNYLALFAKSGKMDMAEAYNVASCVECGTCSYNCPGNVPIVQYIRMAKGKIAERRRMQAAAIAASRPAENVPVDSDKAKKKEAH